MDSRNPNSVRRLYEEAGRAAILKTARMVGRHDVAEEIVQTAFMKLWNSGLTFRDERAAYAWIFRTCHNAGIDHLRSHATRFEAGEEAGESVERIGGVDQEAVILRRRWLLERLQSLSGKEAQVLAYRVLEGMTQEDIAEVMGISRKTVVRICRKIVARIGEPIDADDGLPPSAKERGRI